MKKIEPRDCKYCQVEFQPNTAQSRFCKKTCRDRAKYLRYRAKYMEIRKETNRLRQNREEWLRSLPVDELLKIVTQEDDTMV